MRISKLAMLARKDCNSTSPDLDGAMIPSPRTRLKKKQKILTLFDVGVKPQVHNQPILWPDHCQLWLSQSYKVANEGPTDQKGMRIGIKLLDKLEVHVVALEHNQEIFVAEAGDEMAGYSREVAARLYNLFLSRTPSNITKTGSDVSRRGRGGCPPSLKKIYQPCAVKNFPVPPCFAILVQSSHGLFPVS
jgi:hypothetical protein